MKTVIINNFEVINNNIVMVNFMCQLDWAKGFPDSW